jgi:hypothetical protein
VNAGGVNVGSGWRVPAMASVLSAISDEYARLVLNDPVRFPPERLLRHARWCLS